MRSDDIAPMLTPQQMAELGFRQGRVIAWDPVTGMNQIEIAGQIFDDLPTLANTGIALAVGDLVAVLRYQSTYQILGRINTVGNQRNNFLVAGVMGPADSQFASWYNTTSGSYTNLYSAFIYRSGTKLKVWSRSLVEANTSGQYALIVDGVTRAESTVYVGGVSGSIGNLDLEFVWTTEIYGDALSISLAAKRTAGAGKVGASVQGIWAR